MDFVGEVVDTVTVTIYSFMIYTVLEAFMVTAFAILSPALAVLLTGSFSIATVLDLVKSIRAMDASRTLKTFVLASVQVILTLYLIKTFGF